MPISWVGDDDKIDMADHVKDIITEHEHANTPAALIDAGCQYGQRRQFGESHAQAVREVETIVYNWYGLTPPTPPFVELPRVTVAGQFFRVNGEPWTMIECSDFNLLGRYVIGEDIVPVIQQREVLGFNTLRVFTAYDVDGIGRLIPSADMYNRLPEFLDLCATFGMYVELVAFTGPYNSFFANDDQKVAHWEAIKGMVANKTNVFLELVNEYDNSPNKDIPLSRLSRPNGILASAGSNSADAAGVEPAWDYSSYHSNDLNEWWRKTGHNTMSDVADKFRVPGTANENTRFPDRDGSLNHAYDAAKAAALLCAGSCFHSVNGKSSNLWNEAELNFAYQWSSGARSVPLKYQAGAYHHRAEFENSEVLRAYDRKLSDGDEFIVRIGY